MQVTVQRISPVFMELQIEVPADAVKTEVEKAYATLAKKSHVKGFRPGKAPRAVLTHLFGPRVQNDVATALVNETLPKVLTENNVSPIGQPSVQAGEFGYRNDVETALQHTANGAKTLGADCQPIFGNLIGDAMKEQDGQKVLARPVRGRFHGMRPLR